MRLNAVRLLSKNIGACMENGRNSVHTYIYGHFVHHNIDVPCVFVHLSPTIIITFECTPEENIRSIEFVVLQ